MKVSKLQWTSSLSLCSLSVVTLDVTSWTDELGSCLERPIYFECKLNEPMHIGMQLLHPAATDHNVSINRQQVQCIFSFSLRAERLNFSAPDFCWTSEFNELSTLFGRLSCWWYGTTALVVLPMSSGLHTLGCTTPCLCCRWPSHLCVQHVKIVFSLEENSRVRFLANLTLRLYKDELGLASDNVSPVRFWMRLLPGAGWWWRSLPHVPGQ